MKTRSSRVVFALVVSTVAAACNLEVAPPPPIPPVAVSIDFCSDETPIWVGYQHIGESWERLIPDANGTVSFTSEYRVALAFVRQNGTDTHTELIYTTSNVLAAVSNRICQEESGTKTLNGTVINFSGSDRALVGMGVSSVYRLPGQNSFTLGNLPARPLDIMASRMSFTGTLVQHATKTIIRRNQDLVHNTSITPALDFDATEAFTPTTANIAVSDLAAGDYAFLTSNFFSQLETTHLLSHVEPIGNGTHQVKAIPLATSAAGEYHDVFVTAISSTGTVRGGERFFRTPGNQGIEVGPELSEPTITEIATSPYLRLRMQLPWQADYPSVVSVDYAQQLQFSANRYTVTVTAGYVGTSVFTWDVPMESLSGAPGWQNNWGLQNGAYDWTVTAYGVRSELLFGAPPIENELAQYALRMSDPDSPMLRRAHAPRPVMHGFRPRR